MNIKKKYAEVFIHSKANILQNQILQGLRRMLIKKAEVKSKVKKYYYNKPEKN